MSFSPDMEITYTDAIEPAIFDCGYLPFKVSDDRSGEMIDNKIIAGIRESVFVVADC